MEYIRNATAESAANTFTEEEIATPVASFAAVVGTRPKGAKAPKRVAMLIHEVITQMPTRDVIADGDGAEQHLNLRTQSGIRGPEDSGHIFDRVQDSNLLTSGQSDKEQTQVRKWDPPLLYAKKSIFHGVKSTGQSAAKNYKIAIGYTLVEVEEATFLAALVD